MKVIRRSGMASLRTQPCEDFWGEHAKRREESVQRPRGENELEFKEQKGRWPDGESPVRGNAAGVQVQLQRVCILELRFTGFCAWKRPSVRRSPLESSCLPPRPPICLCFFLLPCDQTRTQLWSQSLHVTLGWGHLFAAHNTILQ